MPHTTQPTGGSDATHYTTNRWVCLPHTTPPTGGSATHNITNRWVWCNTLHHQQVGLMHTTSPTGGSVCRSRWVTLTRHHQYSRTRHHGKQNPLEVIIIYKNEGVELTLQEISDKQCSIYCMAAACFCTVILSLEALDVAMHKEQTEETCPRLLVHDSCAYQPEERKFPLHVLLEVGHVGRTSFSVISTVTLPSGDVMLTAVNQVRFLTLK